jgi:hypothetical protein
MEEKKDKIKKLTDEHKRYYPMDNRGNLDEWAAVIKHQEEQYSNEMERRKITKVNQQKQYSDDLKKGIEDK